MATPSLSCVLLSVRLVACLPSMVMAFVPAVTVAADSTSAVGWMRTASLLLPEALPLRPVMVMVPEAEVTRAFSFKTTP